MERGGGYFSGSFIAGAIVAAAVSKITHAQIPYTVPLICSIALFPVFIFTLTTAKGIKRCTTIICFAIFFLCGYANMLRPENTRFDQEVLLECKFIGSVQEFLNEKASSFISDPQDRAVLTALTSGNKSLLSRETKSAYSKSGAMHILALSGLHIGIIYTILSTLLFFLDKNILCRQIKIHICTAALFLYAAATGFSASVLRASIMITTWKIISLSNRKSGRWDAVLLSATIILLINPAQLLEIGFQLSYAAVAGIIAIFPYIKNASSVWSGYKFARYLNPVWNLMAISVACQIATAPLTLYYFTSLPQFFLLTNLIAIPFVSIVLYSFAVTCLTDNIPFLGDCSETLLKYALWVMNYIIKYIGN